MQIGSVLAALQLADHRLSCSLGPSDFPEKSNPGWELCLGLSARKACGVLAAWKVGDGMKCPFLSPVLEGKERNGMEKSSIEPLERSIQTMPRC